MALKIRLRQQGRTNRQTYRVVVTDIRCKRDGKYLEMLGWYNPFQAENNVSVDPDRISFWLSQGAQISEQVKTLLKKAAPDVLKKLNETEHAKRIKLAAKRRASKKKEK
jgi:small subunit ribosomal protein S16